MIHLIFGSVLIILFTLWYYVNTKKPDKFPPGPPRYPLIGSLPFMLRKGSSRAEKSFMHGILHNIEQYGKVVGFYMGSKRFVVIGDYDIMKDLLKRDEVSGRPPVAPLSEFRPGYNTLDSENYRRAPGVLFSQGSYWREQRRFLLRNLRDFGFGKSEMEDAMLDEIDKLCIELQKYVGKPKFLGNTLNLSIVNALWAILVGEHLPLDDPMLLRIVDCVNSFIRDSSGLNRWANIAPHPRMLLLFKNYFKIHKLEELLTSIGSMVEKQVEDHQKTRDKDNARDMMDLFLNEIENTTDPNSSFYGTKGHYAMVNDHIDLFLAGMETTSTSLNWTFLYLLHHPEIKCKIHDELDKVVGAGNVPRLIHRDDMHYTKAFLLESLRMSSIVILALPHYTFDNISVGSYVIPKGTTVLPSIMSVLTDPEHFENPHTFNPSRFLDDEGIFQNDEHVIAFSIGKRYCLGQSLAEKEFFLFFTGLMQKFDISHPSGETLPSYHIKDSVNTGTIRSTPMFNLILTNRNES